MFSRAQIAVTRNPDFDATISGTSATLVPGGISRDCDPTMILHCKNVALVTHCDVSQDFGSPVSEDFFPWENATLRLVS